MKKVYVVYWSACDPFGEYPEMEIVCVCLSEESAKKEVERLALEYDKGYCRYLLLQDKCYNAKLNSKDRAEYDKIIGKYELYGEDASICNNYGYGYQEINLID